MFLQPAELVGGILPGAKPSDPDRATTNYLGLDVCSVGAADGKNTSTSQGPINFVRIAYRTSSAVDETPSLRIAEAR